MSSARRAAPARRPPRKRVEAPKVVEGSLDGAGLRIAIVVSRFNEFVGSRLLDGALHVLERRGVKARDTVVIKVPGAFEIPAVAKRLADSRRHDAVICLGAVLRGETPHFEWVAGEASSGIARASYETGVPVLFGVLTGPHQTTAHAPNPELWLCRIALVQDRSGHEVGSPSRLCDF